MVKLSKADMRILEAVQRAKIGIGCYQIARETSKDAAFVHRRLCRLFKHSILERINSKPVLYIINLKQKKTFLNIFVKCPKCKGVYRLHYEQNTKVCENSDCVTPSGVRTRFHITENRIVEYKNMI